MKKKILTSLTAIILLMSLSSSAFASTVTPNNCVDHSGPGKPCHEQI
ncbi:hypothetical protein [Heyndrickxia oleronia]|nr:hypothetical protein [Heyndrickxia oleronia]MBU5212483.1 hypothetical protein [Heyndrickxia oleronia]